MMQMLEFPIDIHTYIHTLLYIDAIDRQKKKTTDTKKKVAIT